MDQMNQGAMNRSKVQPVQPKDECKWQMPGMAYVPWQTFTKTYDPRKALMAGTIFPELDKPFTGKCMMNQGGRYR